MNWVIFFSCLIVLLLFGRSERSKSFICSNPNCDFSGKIVAKRELIPSSSKEIGLSRSEGLIITLWVWECPKCGTELRQSKKNVGGHTLILFLVMAFLIVWMNTSL